MSAYDEVTKVLNQTEMATLWLWHRDMEKAAAERGDYDAAKQHRDRKSLFWREPSTPP